MADSTAPAAPRRRSLWVRCVAGALLAAAALAAILVVMPWDLLREPLNRLVSEKTGRQFQIKHLDVHWSLRGPTIVLDGIELANPDWARDPWLLRARRAELDVRLWPLLIGKVVIPRLALQSPSLGLQLQQDGRRSWALGQDRGGNGTVPSVGALQVDGGTLSFLAEHLGADLEARFQIDEQGGALPLAYSVEGRYQRQPLTATGRAGSVLQLSKAAEPVPFEIEVAAGQTRLQASGTLAKLDGLDGIDAQVELKGQTLGALYPLLGIALPQTSPYAVSGRVKKGDAQWQVLGLEGRLGLSDIRGDLRFDESIEPPHLTGSLHSDTLDMDDLAPLIGLPPTARAARAVEGVAPPPSIGNLRRARGPRARVLPDVSLDLDRLAAMNADVKYLAARIRNARGIPLERASVQIGLNDRVLTLEPLELGVAGGKLAGTVRIDGRRRPAEVRTSLDVRALQINRLIPKIETMKSSLGRLDGRINLAGSGSSMAAWLGAAAGDVAVVTGGGRFSNLLLEFMGLDGGEIIKFLLSGDTTVKLRCAALAFDVQRGVMHSRAFILDTEDTVFYGSGRASLADESLDFVVRPEPKDVSILSLRGPLRIGGTFAHPSAGVEPGPLAERGLAALALSAINPLLALLATVETGPGENADCQAAVKRAGTPVAGPAARGAAAARRTRN